MDLVGADGGELLQDVEEFSSSLPAHPVVGAIASTTWAGIQFI
jgi:hypothetical protein